MIFDLHNDFPTVLEYNAYGKYIRKCRSYQAVATAVIWTSEFKNAAVKKVSDITSSLEDVNGNSELKFPIAIEDLGFLSDGDYYKDFDFSKYLYCSLTWNYNNGFAGGALDDGELTKRGMNIIERMNMLGCVVDLAHLNRKSFYQALDCAKNVICSHTGFNKHLRSLDGDQIETLVKRNGVIGLCTVTKFTDAYDLASFEAVIDGFVQKYGIDRLAIGTDFNGSIDIPIELSDYNGFAALSTGLRSRGYTIDDIDKLFYSNAYSITYRE